MARPEPAKRIHHSFSDFDRDVWKLADLGVDDSSVTSHYKLTFTAMEPEWFKRVVKEYLYRRLHVLAPSSCHSILTALTCFARFLKQRQITSPTHFDRPLMLAYLSFLTSQNLKAASRAVYTIHLKTFLSICAREDIGELPAKELLYDDDIPCVPTPLPRSIPEDVLVQLNRHLDDLTPDDPYFHWRSMILVIQECGMRISEALSLPFGCIEQDQEGDWFIRFSQTKTRTEHAQPISKECAAVVQQQQASVTRVWGDEMALLFPNRRGRAYTSRAFAVALDKFGAAKGIRDGTGRLWKFQSHQFRHTVGTRLINNGMNSYHVQLMLGHKSPEMTVRYARVHHSTLKKQYQEYLAKRVLVDLSGQVLTETSPPGDAVDLKILTRGLQAQTLPNGYCGYPVAQGPCPHSNACLSCRHFRTDQTFVPILRRQLDETKKLLDEATVNNWQRVVEMSRVVEANLERILPILEGSDEP